MNQLKAEVIQIKRVDTLNYLTFSINQQLIYILSLELNPILKVGTTVHLGIKSTHVVIAKELEGLLSLENRLRAKIVSIENGEILSSICLDIEGFLVESIISMDSKERMNLQIDDNVFVLINSADISILSEKRDI